MKQWQKTTLRNIGNAVEFVQDCGLWPEPYQVRGFTAFRVWMDGQYVIFAQPLGITLVACTPPVDLPWREWKSPYVKEEQDDGEEAEYIDQTDVA